MAKFLTVFSVGALLAAPLAALTAEADSPVVGKLRLVKNGQEVVLGSGLRQAPAELQLIDLAGQERIRVRVGKGGAFASALAAGDYLVSGIDFLVRGERVSAKTNLVLTVDEDSLATYVGTVTLQATFESGYHGLAGTIDGYSVADDCVTDCAPMLSALDLRDSAVTVALLRPNLELVSHQQ